MKRRTLYMIELETSPAPTPEQQNTPLDHNREFKENFQTAILLSLLEKGQLAKWQFDYCLEELAKQRLAASNKT